MIDELDQQILRLLEENSRRPVKEIAPKVCLSAPAVKERILKLEEKSIITGYTLQIDYLKAGKAVQAFVLFETTNCQAFREFAQKQPEVLECHRVAGKYSYLVKVAVENMEKLETFIDKALKYGSSSTHIIFSTQKNPFFN
ncbi:Lrp/AsnC family leucine-responsive transcriptional regulator [Enterococcus sp. PF1-24]|uniref:Lrp/AsnC family transcriptional regulator n=1 Tax=unclassified Enterococcus TaxID=2608891 RepID=UPI002473CB2A|nr:MULTISPECIES: Lrp/AsnC family transcriptional regulator [unclassified Enterococcus]MDH6365639.1 Lrp/AsnC family leucine-responsive transcriptional regulator [Enterococcus sp. PFB1-1]MDH6402740.1 Lrp/AsnC family leucine-responsive transcriptional regulator [Enterococcus sp. PF1-24]